MGDGSPNPYYISIVPPRLIAVAAIVVVILTFATLVGDAVNVELVCGNVQALSTKLLLGCWLSQRAVFAVDQCPRLNRHYCMPSLSSPQSLEVVVALAIIETGK